MADAYYTTPDGSTGTTDYYSSGVFGASNTNWPSSQENDANLQNIGPVPWSSAFTTESGVPLTPDQASQYKELGIPVLDKSQFPSINPNDYDSSGNSWSIGIPSIGQSASSWFTGTNLIILGLGILAGILLIKMARD